MRVGPQTLSTLYCCIVKVYVVWFEKAEERLSSFVVWVLSFRVEVRSWVNGALIFKADSPAHTKIIVQ